MERLCCYGPGCSRVLPNRWAKSLRHWWRTLRHTAKRFPRLLAAIPFSTYLSVRWTAKSLCTASPLSKSSCLMRVCLLSDKAAFTKHHHCKFSQDQTDIKEEPATLGLSSVPLWLPALGRLGEEGLGRKLGRATEQACKRRGSAQRPLATNPTCSPNPSQQAIMSVIGTHIGADRPAS